MTGVQTCALPISFRASLVECPVCKEALLAGQEYIQTGPEDFEWDQATRLWPKSEKHLHWSIPDLVRTSLEEARKCYKAQAYSACAVMCGRTLEGICRQYKTKKKLLFGGLKELLNKQIIDKKIYDWGEGLREYRNIAAHPTGEKISKEVAMDLLDFANAICDYVFVLTDKFNKFTERRKKEHKKKKS